MINQTEYIVVEHIVVFEIDSIYTINQTAYNTHSVGIYIFLMLLGWRPYKKNKNKKIKKNKTFI